jgi:transposase
VDKNDKMDKIASMDEINSNIGHARFVWNKILEFVNHFTNLLIQKGYKKKLIINDKSCNMILNWLKEENDFLQKSESSSLQQAYRDLIIAFKRFFSQDLKSRYPKFKSRKNPKDSFRIMNNSNIIRIKKDKYGYDKLNLAKH